MKKSALEIEEYIDSKIYQIKNGVEAKDNEIEVKSLKSDVWDSDILISEIDSYYLSDYHYELKNNIQKFKIRLIFCKGKNTLILIHEGKGVLWVKVFEHRNFDEICQFIGKNTLDVHFTEEHFLPFGRWFEKEINQIQNLIKNNSSTA